MSAAEHQIWRDDKAEEYVASLSLLSVQLEIIVTSGAVLRPMPKKDLELTIKRLQAVLEKADG